jgi:hypothetical protein
MSRALRPAGTLVGLAAALLAAAALSGCGGSGGSTGPGTGASGTSGSPPKSAQTGSAKTGGKGGRPHRSEGAEEEVEHAGSEAEGSGREAVLSARREYLTAVVEGDFHKACSLLAAPVLQSLEALVGSSKKPPGCAPILAKVLAGPAAASARRDLGGDLRNVRIKGRQALVIFHAPGARLWLFSLLQEDGAWRVGTLTSTVLAPSAATLGE